MKNQKILKLLTLVFTLVILATLSINTFALVNDPSPRLLANIPDSEVDGSSSATDRTPDDSTHRDHTDTRDTDRQTGVLDEALTDASEALDSAKDDMDSAMTDVKDDVKDVVDDAEGGGVMGVIIAILIAVAIIIIIIVMVSKNNGKYNRK